MPDETTTLRQALARLLDCVERLDPDGRGRTDPVTDQEIDAAIDAARQIPAAGDQKPLATAAAPAPQTLAVRLHD